MSLRNIRWEPSVLTLISAGIFTCAEFEDTLFFLPSTHPDATTLKSFFFFFFLNSNPVRKNQRNLILKTLKNHHHGPASQSAGFHSVIWLFAVTFYAMTYLHFPFTPCFKTAGFPLPTCTDVISSSRCFRPHHFRRRTLHRLRARSSDPRITCV